MVLKLSLSFNLSFKWSFKNGVFWGFQFFFLKIMDIWINICKGIPKPIVKRCAKHQVSECASDWIHWNALWHLKMRGGGQFWSITQASQCIPMYPIWCSLWCLTLDARCVHSLIDRKYWCIDQIKPKNVKKVWKLADKTFLVASGTFLFPVFHFLGLIWEIYQYFTHIFVQILIIFQKRNRKPQNNQYFSNSF